MLVKLTKGWEEAALWLVDNGVPANDMIKYAISGATWEDIKNMCDVAWKSKV